MEFERTPHGLPIVPKGQESSHSAQEWARSINSDDKNSAFNLIDQILSEALSKQNLVTSETQPEGQKAGDIWYHVLGQDAGGDGT